MVFPYTHPTITEFPIKGVITLCGSVRFRKQFDEVAAELCFNRWIALSLQIWGTEEKTGYIDDNNPLKELLEEMHRQKIAIGEAIIVINVGGYYGKSTTKEIEYARSIGRRIIWLEWKPDNMTLLKDMSYREFNEVYNNYGKI